MLENLDLIIVAAVVILAAPTVCDFIVELTKGE
jgi:hypothetical protein